MSEALCRYRCRCIRVEALSPHRKFREVLHFARRGLHWCHARQSERLPNYHGSVGNSLFSYLGYQDGLCDRSGDIGWEEAGACLQPQGLHSACVAAIILRLVWVLSLFPIGVLVNGLTNRLLFRAVISGLELLRRSMWFILRVEHEQDALQLLKEKRDSESSLFSSKQPVREDVIMTRAKTLRSCRSTE